MGLGRQVIYLRGFDLRNKTHQITGICHIRIMQKKFYTVVRRCKNVVNSCRIRNTVPAHQSVNLISFFQQELRQIGTVLSGNAGN